MFPQGNCKQYTATALARAVKAGANYIVESLRARWRAKELKQILSCIAIKVFCFDVSWSLIYLSREEGCSSRWARSPLFLLTYNIVSVFVLLSTYWHRDFGYNCAFCFVLQGDMVKFLGRFCTGEWQTWLYWPGVLATQMWSWTSWYLTHIGPWHFSTPRNTAHLPLLATRSPFGQLEYLWAKSHALEVPNLVSFSLRAEPSLRLQGGGLPHWSPQVPSIQHPQNRTCLYPPLRAPAPRCSSPTTILDQV